MRFIIPAGLLCCSCALLCGQDQPAPQPAATPVPVPQVQTPATTKADDNKDEIDGGGAIKLFYWLSKGNVNVVGGKKNPAITAAGGNLLNFAATKQSTPGFTVAFPAGKFNRFEISYFQADGTGNPGAPTQNLVLFGQLIPAGDYLATSYRVRNFKASWNYLTWPEPPEGAKLRIKTLWEVQYTTVASTIDAPFETSIQFAPAIASKHIFYPTFGIGAEYVASRHIYFEGHGSGFALPHRSVLWDAEGNVVVRVKHIEVFGGFKVFHFKTSPNADNYVEATLTGPYGGLRWVF